jgi:hypothetical protein
MQGVPRFLSPAWIEEASAAVSTSAELAEACAGVDLVVQQAVTGGPDGDVRYVVSLRDGEPRLRPGEAEEAAVCFTSGRLTLRGDITALLRHGRALDGLHAVFAELRDRTTY